MMQSVAALTNDAQSRIASRRTFSRASRLVLFLAITIVLISTAQKAYRLTLPTDGWEPAIDPAPNFIFSENVLGLDSALRPGDQLLAVEGQDVTNWIEKGYFGQLHRPTQWLAGQTLAYTVQRDGQTQTIGVPLGHWTIAAHAREALNWFVLTAIPSLLLGIFVFVKRPGQLAAQLLFLAGALDTAVAISHVGSSGGLETAFASAALFRLAFFCSHIIPPILSPALILAILYIFPVVNPLVRRRRWLLYFVVIGVPATIILDDFFGTYLPVIVTPVWILFALIASISVVIYNLFTVREPVARAQSRWIGLALAYAGLDIMISVLAFTNVLPRWADTWLPLPGINGNSLPQVLIAIAIVRYRLFDIDIIINRALVYGSLTLLVFGAYIGIVGTLGSLLPGENRLFLSLVATGIVAVLFQPLRERVQRGVNRLLYGERDEPYAVLARLGRRLEETLAPDAILPTIVAMVREALKLPYVGIALHHAGATTITAASGTPGEASLRLPLIAGREEVGELLLAPRAPGEAFGPADQRLLADLARQIGVAAQAVLLHEQTSRLNADLQASRERLVTTREEERRRLRRDLHDGLGPVLGSLTLKLDVADDLLDRDPAEARALLRDLRTQSQSAVADIRRLVYALRPPALDELGIVGALRQAAGGYGPAAPQVIVEAPEPLPPLPAAVEVAAFRIAQEALTNVVKHAAATRCTVRLALDPDALRVEITDDGRGIAASRIQGVGLSSMRERAEELGGSCRVEPEPSGGTRVSATLPCSAEASAHTPKSAPDPSPPTPTEKE